jgi:hypothetical protein
VHRRNICSQYREKPDLHPAHTPPCPSRFMNATAQAAFGMSLLRSVDNPWMNFALSLIGRGNAARHPYRSWE